MGNKNDFPERRRCERKAVQVPVTYKLLSPSTDMEEFNRESIKRAATSLNISENGIQLEIDGREIESDQIVGVEISPAEDDYRIKTFAEVRWSKFDDKLGKFRVGMQFLAVKDGDKDRIQKLS